MLRVRFDHDVDEEGDESVRALFATRNMSHQSCTGIPRSQSVSLLRHRVSNTASPKMTLQQFSTQISLSRGALYWFILHNSLCAKFRKLCTCLRDPLLGPGDGDGDGFGGSGSFISLLVAVMTAGDPSFGARRGEDWSGVAVAEASEGDGIGRSRCFGSIQEKMRIRCRKTSSRSMSPDGDMLSGNAERSIAGEKVLYTLTCVRPDRNAPPPSCVSEYADGRTGARADS